jgi:hypothetical protein
LQARFTPEKALKHIEDGITWKAEPLAFLQKIHSLLKKGDGIVLAVNTAVSNPDPDVTVKLSAAADADDTVKMDVSASAAALGTPSRHQTNDLSGKQPADAPSAPSESHDVAKAAAGCMKKLSGLGKGEQQHATAQQSSAADTHPQCSEVVLEESNPKNKRRSRKRRRVNI